MDCDIIIPVYNQLNYTKACLESIKKHADYPYRVIVVDDASSKDTAEYLDRLNSENEIVLLRNQENLGWVKSVNKGIDFSKAKYICVMNNDILVYPSWLSEMVKIAQNDSQIGLVNPLWEKPKNFRGSRNEYFKKVVCKCRGKFIETDWARGFCFLVTREVIKKIGGLDQAFAPAYFDDWDYSIRAIEAGFYCVQTLGAFVWHYRNITYGLSFSTEALQQKSKIFYNKWGVPLKILLLSECPQPSLSSEYINFTRQILNYQNKLTIITTNKFPILNKHTNLILRHINCRFLFRIYIFWQLLDNLRYAKKRRYDIILCSDDLYHFLQAQWFIKNSCAKKLYTLKNFEHNELISKIIALKHQKAEHYI